MFKDKVKRMKFPGPSCWLGAYQGVSTIFYFLPTPWKLFGCARLPNQKDLQNLQAEGKMANTSSRNHTFLCRHGGTTFPKSITANFLHLSTFHLNASLWKKHVWTVLAYHRIFKACSTSKDQRVSWILLCNYYYLSKPLRFHPRPNAIPCHPSGCKEQNLMNISYWDSARCQKTWRLIVDPFSLIFTSLAP